MKKLPLPEVNDVEKTTELSENERLHRTSFPHLRNRLDDVLACYQSYSDCEGDALAIASLGLSDSLKSGLRKNYTSPPDCLDYISEIRNTSPRVCPMCGSLKPSTLDHVLPKEDYAEYAVYSRNLVPACDCNSKRGTTLLDAAASVRVLHPYFDECLTERLISCEISPAPDFPMAHIQLSFLDPAHPLAGSIEFHTKNIILKAGIITWLSGQWSSAVECPGIVIQTLPHSVLTVEEMQLALEDSLSRFDRNYGSPNNWQSIFVHGLLASAAAMEWLMSKHNDEYA